MLVADVDFAHGMPGAPDLPPELQASMRRHQTHLGALVVSLRAVGVDENVVEASVKQLLTSYALELTAAIRTFTLRPVND